MWPGSVAPWNSYFYFFHVVALGCQAQSLVGLIPGPAQFLHKVTIVLIKKGLQIKVIMNITIEGGGLAVKSVVPSSLRCGGPKFESHNGKRLGLNLTIPTLDPLVPSWGWDNIYGLPVPSGPNG